MANILIEQATMTAIADAIRSKLGETLTYLPSEMPAKILSITGGGGVPSTILYAHSPNVDNNGTISGTYANNLNYVEVFTIPGAQRLKIEIQYSTESTNYDYICVWQGGHSDYTPSANNSTAVVPDGATSSKIGGGSNATTFTGNATVYVDGDTVTIGMKSDSSQGYAGYHATISAVAAGGDTPTPGVFSWGSETGDADATWWANLKTWVATASTTELAACVGKKKSVTLTFTTPSIKTTHNVICVGYNCNRDINNLTRNTLTFATYQADNGYLNYSTSQSYAWNQSTVRNYCDTYETNFPGKASLATVSIGYADGLSASQNATVSYINGKVFAPSEAELNMTASPKASSKQEFDKNNTSKTPYQYFTSNNARGSIALGNYWLRSMYYSNYSYRLSVEVSVGSSVVDATGNTVSQGNARVVNYNGNSRLACFFVI